MDLEKCKEQAYSSLKERLIAHVSKEEETELSLALDTLHSYLPIEGSLAASLLRLIDGQYPQLYGVSAVSFLLGVASIVVTDLRLSQTAVEALFLLLPSRWSPIFQDISHDASPEALSLLHQLLRVQKIFSEKGKEASDEEVRELLVSSAGDVRVLLLMIAWRLYLLRRGKELLSKEEASQLGDEVSRFFIPLTHKLGLYAVKSELEDLSLKFTKPDAFYAIKTKLGEKKVERDNYMRRVVRLIDDRFQRANVRWHYNIKSRTKSIFSVYNKMEKKKVSFDNIYDLSALRIIIRASKEEEETACWYFYSLVTDLFEPNPKRLRDWISVPKQNGYQSLQITVKGPDNKFVEVQIRTEEMDEVAEHGVAAHWRYKGLGGEASIDSSLAHARSLLEAKEDSEQTESARYTITKAKYIFAFTPLGKPIKLPQGATLLDFAFAIHTNIGYHTRGGKINGKNASIRSLLQSGDTVEVLTDRNQTPNKDWLQIVVSSSARNKIQRFLREEKEGSFREVREQIERRLKNRKVPLDEKLYIQSFNQLGYRDYNSFYTAVIEGKCDVSRWLETYEEKLATPQKPYSTPQEEAPKKRSRAEETPNVEDKSVVVSGVKGSIYYELAKCCSPQYGDAIFAYPSRLGIRIHRYDCPNAKDIFQNFRERVLPAHWKNLEDRTRTNLYVEAIDDNETTGRVLSLCKLHEGTSLLSYNIKSSMGKIEAEFTIEGAQPSVNALRNKLLATKGVLSVSRA